MHSRLGLIRVLAAMVVLALAVGVPTASAAPSKIDKAQTKAIKKGAKSIKNIRKAAKGVGTAIAALTIVAERGDKNAATILAVAPSILKGLTDLKAGLEAAGAGLNSLKTLATATEYGFGQVVVGATPQGGSFVVTPDIPDSVQQAQTTQEFLSQTAGDITVLYGVRSFESDGTGAALPAAHCKVTVTNEGGTTQTTAPNAGLGGVPFQPVDTKSVPTSTVPANAGFPFGLKTAAPDADVTVPLATTVPVVIGETYTIGMSCVDVSASAADPSA